MPKTNRIRFRVQGSGTFPFDMLRYDGCYPESQDDVHRMLDSAYADPTLGTVRIVNLIQPVVAGFKKVVTVERWESFGWKVIQQEKLS